MPMSTVNGEAFSSRQWSCDVCKAAIFDDFKVALHHEARCRLRLKREEMRSLKTEGGVPREVICVKKIPGTSSLGSRSYTTTPTLPTATTPSVDTTSLEFENENLPTRNHHVVQHHDVVGTSTPTRRKPCPEFETDCLSRSNYTLTATSTPTSTPRSSRNMHQQEPGYNKVDKGATPTRRRPYLEFETDCLSKSNNTLTETSTPTSTPRSSRNMHQQEPGYNKVDKGATLTRRKPYLEFETDCLSRSNNTLTSTSTPTSTPRSSRNMHQQEPGYNKVVKGAKWVCDVCQVAKFVRYVDAYKHEKICSGLQSDHNGERQLSALDVGESELSSSQAENRIPRSNEEHQICVPPKAKKGSLGGLKWLCGVCEIVCFDNYEKAFRHEKLCALHHNKRNPFTDMQLLDHGEYYGD
jgi:hypothetical protein